MAPGSAPQGPATLPPLGGAVRPQSVLLTFFGDYIADDAEVLVSAASVIELLDRVGVQEYAARATLARMVRRGLLHRHVDGRRAYYGLTEQGRQMTVSGRTQVMEDQILTRTWNGRWTMVTFSMPESWQRRRHDLRARLIWSGFGMLQAGVWVAPRQVDVPSLLERLGVDDHVRVFDVAPLPPADAASLLGEAFDLTALGERYAGFEERWRPLEEQAAHLPDPLARRILLSGEWLQIMRDDPRLPLEYLPPDWPGTAAETLYRGLMDALRRPAQHQLAFEVEVLTPAG